MRALILFAVLVSPLINLATMLNVTAFQHRFNTETDSAPFSLHIRYSLVFNSASYVFMDSLHTYASLAVSYSPVATCTHLAT